MSVWVIVWASKIWVYQHKDLLREKILKSCFKILWLLADNLCTTRFPLVYSMDFSCFWVFVDVVRWCDGALVRSSFEFQLWLYAGCDAFEELLHAPFGSSFDYSACEMMIFWYSPLVARFFIFCALIYTYIYMWSYCIAW